MNGEILGPDGRPARPLRRPTGDRCPRCGAGKDRRMDGGGYGGAVVIVCGKCGYQFEEHGSEP